MKYLENSRSGNGHIVQCRVVQDQRLGAVWFFGVLALVCLGLAGCGVLKPGTPGHEPPSGGNYNPVSHEVNESPR